MKQNRSPKRKRRLLSGPGALVAAAFIGPGTVTTCSMAGASFGYALLWGLLFSVLATIVLQEMAARLGVVAQQGLGEALRQQFSAPLGRVLMAVLVLSAIVVGNAAFETGNILGASIGLDAVLPMAALSHKFWVLVCGALAFLLLFLGNYRLLEKIMTALVIIMSIAFVATAVLISPDIKEILKGLFVPKLPPGSLLTLVGLIGTTVVPYNLFLHASAVKERWKDASGLGEARSDISVSVLLGGLISMAIVITASGAFFGSGTLPQSAADLGNQLEPLWGRGARYLTGIGLFAAGLSSSITAPLAAAWAAFGVLGRKADPKNLYFRLTWGAILAAGMAFALTGVKPLEVIVFAQAANGILLPLVAVFLLLVMNNRRIMGSYVNGRLSNILGLLVVLTALALGLRSLLLLF